MQRILKMKHKSKKIRNPVQVFNECPMCKSRDLLRLQVDVLCSECDWMSCEEYVGLGGMDNIFAAYNDHFPMSQEEEVTSLLAEQRKDFSQQDERQDDHRLIEVGA